MRGTWARALIGSVLAVVIGGGSACSGEQPAVPDADDEPEPTIAACPAPAPAAATGEATYYSATGEGSCSFDASSDKLVAALNGADYGNAELCGACMAVTGPQGSVTVRVVDKCPGCAKGDLDLSREAFEKISPLSAGRVDIRWKLVPCDVEGGLGYHFKDGSSKYWSAIQVRNHKYPIAKLEAKDASGTYKPIARESYNYFVAANSQLGAGPFTFRVTDTRGQVVEDSAIVLGDSVTRAGAAQFPTCTGD